MPTIRNGRNTQLLLQREAAFRTAPAAAAFSMKFSELEYGRDPNRQEDPTIKNTPMPVKMDTGDPVIAGKIKSILCLNDIGQWLSLLWGTPVTTGIGPYTHTFTASLAARPSALLELGYIAASKYPRWLGNMVSAMSWNILEGNQSVEIDLIGGEEVEPEPVTAFDAAPTEYTKNRACSKGGEVYDVGGASTLGRISAADIRIANDLTGYMLADGLTGYGAIEVGQPTIEGSVTALFDEETNIFDHGRAHTSKPMTLLSKNVAGDASLKVILPAVEFDEPKHIIPNSKGLLVTTNWRAHDGTAPTIELLNSIASY